MSDVHTFTLATAEQHVIEALRGHERGIQSVSPMARGLDGVADVGQYIVTVQAESRDAAHAILEGLLEEFDPDSYRLED